MYATDMIDIDRIYSKLDREDDRNRVKTKHNKAARVLKPRKKNRAGQS